MAIKVIHWARRFVIYYLVIFGTFCRQVQVRLVIVKSRASAAQKLYYLVQKYKC